MKLLRFFVPSETDRTLRAIRPLLATINQLEPAFEALSDEELRAKTAELRTRFTKAMEQRASRIEAELAGAADDAAHPRMRQKHEQAILGELLPEAFATVREAAKRSLGLRHYDEQLLGGMVLHQGKIAEMKTGEGKTLVATLPAYLNALAGHGVHIVTVNDYLAKRDAAWMGEVYTALGVTCAAIGHEQSWLYQISDTGSQTPDTDEVGKIRHPTSDIRHPDSDWPNLQPITRRDAYAADITYGTNNEFGFDYLRDNMAQNPTQLVLRRSDATSEVGAPTGASEQRLYFAIVDEVDSILIDEARTPLIISAPAAESTNLYQTFAGVAKRLTRDTDYTVDEKFRATAITDSGIAKVEDWVGVPHFYAPENVTLVHHLEEALKAQALFTRDKDYVVREGEVVIVDEFTGRMMPGRRYSEGLHQAIEAKEGVEVKRESDTLATISFQNLFRLYPKLSGMTGTAATEAEEFWKIYQIEVVEVPTHRPLVRIDHQDLIYKTTAAKLTAVVAEIKRRQECGQPVLVGTISVEKNEQLSKLLKQAGVRHEILNAKYHEREAKIIANAGTVGAVTVATNMAGRGVDIILGGEPPKIEGLGTSSSGLGQTNEKTQPPTTSPQSLNDQAHQKLMVVWKEQHQRVLELGGLCVIGTERHEARRIDNQLRGRSGRQGDPGETQFYVSMDDDLMRIFGGERMKSLMDRLGVPDDQPIQAGMISRSIETAQRRVEGHNFDTRKHLVEYDDVMNKHREFIYRLRRKILLGVEGLGTSSLGLGQTNENTQPLTASPQSLSSWLHDYTTARMSEEELRRYTEKIAEWPAELRSQIERAVWLRTIDTFWVEHLNSMEALRAGIGLRGYGQHDPLVAYRQEGYQLFERLKAGIEQEVVRVLLNLEVRPQTPQPLTTSPQSQNLRLQGADDSRSAGFREASNEQRTASGIGLATSPQLLPPQRDPASAVAAPNPSHPKVGRNDPCPCGSGKKSKKCHGK